MSYIINCYTLHDITPTGVVDRHKPAGDDWAHRRNTQCNFDTVIQAISLRSQPEDISVPELIKLRFTEFDHFGFLFRDEEEEIPCWKFTFKVAYSGVFNDGISDLGALYTDCDMVPMIKCHTAWDKLPAFLDSSDELRNIYFECV